MELTPEALIALNRLTLVARLVAATVHDVNNALQIVSGSVELLARQQAQPSTDAVQQAVQRIQGQGVRAAKVLDDLMQFARGSGESTRSLSLRAIVSEAAAMRAFAVRRAGLLFDFDAATSPLATVSGRRGELQQAVLNLLINAEQALRETRAGTIKAEVTETSTDASLRILDNGPGLDPRIEARVFEPFVTSRPVPDASGLGLTVARLIAEGHGGDLTIDRREAWTCATLRIPIAR